MAAKTNKKHENGFGMDILWPPADKGDHESDVDIVFVHGLNGKRHATWTKGDVLWPRDLLAQDFPTARIMTWGYDARVMQFFGPVGQGSIHDHANELNNDLRQERIGAHQLFRPLIFFAHSLGGLVVKSALFRSYLAGVSGTQVTDHCAAIEKSTAGVIFAGTPHRGSDQTKWAKSATNMAKVVQKDHSSRMSQALERGSQTLEQLGDYFKNIQYNFNIFTFTEELPCHKIGRIVEPDSAVMNCEHEKTRMIHANHMEMVRYDDRSSNEYKKMKDAFQQVHHQLSRHGLHGTRQRAASLTGNRGSYMRIPDEYLPRNSIQQGPAVPQRQTTPQRTIELGRVNTVATEDYLAPSRRPAAVEASPRPFYQNLSNRASTTTIGTVGSGSSRGSDQSIPRLGERQPSSPNQRDHRSSRGSDQSSPRLTEQPNHQHQSSTPPPPAQPEYLTHLNQAHRLVRLRGPNFASNLRLAHNHFTRALSLLGHPATPGTTPALRLEHAKIKYQLMNLEFESAFNRDFSSQEKLSALSRAEQWGWEARDDASASTSSSAAAAAATTGSSSPPSSSTNGPGEGLIAQISLYLSILLGRTAEVSSRLGVSATETARKKQESVAEIFASLKKIRASCPEKLKQSEKFAKTWVERLGGVWVEHGDRDGESSSGGSGRENNAGGEGGVTATEVVVTPPASDLGTSFSTTTTATTPVTPPTQPAMASTVFPSAAELDSAPSPRASIADLSDFAELDISGQLMRAQYLQREGEEDHQYHHHQQQQQQQQQHQSPYLNYNYDINSDRDPGLGVSLGLGSSSRYSYPSYTAAPQPQNAEKARYSHSSTTSNQPPPSQSPPQHQHQIPETEDANPNDDPPPAYSPYLS